MATVFTIYAGLNGPLGTEEEHKAILLRILAESGIDGYTLTEGIGVYAGQPELCAVVVLIATNDADASDLSQHVAEVAIEYKDETSQQEVWITRRKEELLIV